MAFARTAPNEAIELDRIVEPTDALYAVRDLVLPAAAADSWSAFLDALRALQRWAPLRITGGGPLGITRSQNRGRKMHVSMRLSAHTGFILAARITLRHFSVSAAMNFPNWAGDRANGVPPKSAIRAFNLASARPALISLLILSMTSGGVHSIDSNIVSSLVDLAIRRGGLRRERRAQRSRR
jgi:hypothetical protein